MKHVAIEVVRNRTGAIDSLVPIQAGHIVELVQGGYGQVLDTGELVQTLREDEILYLPVLG